MPGGWRNGSCGENNVVMSALNIARRNGQQHQCRNRRNISAAKCGSANGESVKAEEKAAANERKRMSNGMAKADNAGVMCINNGVCQCQQYQQWHHVAKK
jgi:hypothetical protein